MKLIQVLTLTTITLLALSCTPARQLAEQQSQPETKTSKAAPYLESKAKTVIIGANTQPKTSKAAVDNQLSAVSQKPIAINEKPSNEHPISNPDNTIQSNSQLPTAIIHSNSQPIAQAEVQTPQTPTKPQAAKQESPNTTVNRQPSTISPSSPKLTEKVQLVLSADREVVVDLHIIPRGEANVRLIQKHEAGNEDAESKPEMVMPKSVTGYETQSALANRKPISKSASENTSDQSESEDFDLFAAFVEETQQMDEAEDPQEVLQRLLAARIEEGKHSEPISRAMEIPTVAETPAPTSQPVKTEGQNYIKVEIAAGKVVRLKEDVLEQWESAIASGNTAQADLPAWIFQGLERITDIPLIEPIRTDALTPMYKYMINAGLLDDVNVNSMKPTQVVRKMRIFFDTMKANQGKLSI